MTAAEVSRRGKGEEVGGGQWHDGTGGFFRLGKTALSQFIEANDWSVSSCSPRLMHVIIIYLMEDVPKYN